MHCRIEYEFEFDLQKGEQYNLEILDCVEEDVPEVIQNALDNIAEGIRRISFQIKKL